MTTVVATTKARPLTPRSLTLSGRRRQRAAGERIGELFEEHGRMVYGVCRWILRDPTEAEDAAQQTFLSAYRALLNGRRPRDPSAWLGTIARNECRGRLRSRKTEPLTLVTAATADDTHREAARHEEVERWTAALAELPPQQRDAIVLRESRRAPRTPRWPPRSGSRARLSSRSCSGAAAGCRSTCARCAPRSARSCCRRR